MTTIAAIVRLGRAFIAGDRAIQHNYTTHLLGETKVWQRGSWLFGLAGNSHGMHLKDVDPIPSLLHPEDVATFLKISVDVAYHQQEGKGFGLLCVHPEYGIYVFTEGSPRLVKMDADYHALGSGSEFALATMRTLLRHSSWPDRQVVFEAMCNAEHFDSSTRAPFDIVHTGQPEASP